MYGADGQENLPHREWLVMFDRVINQVKAEMVELGRPNDFIGAKVSIFFKRCSLFIKDVDYILYDSIPYTRRIGLVFGGLHLLKEGIPASNSRLVFSSYAMAF
jgi:adenosine deaminase CECR1